MLYALLKLAHWVAVIVWLGGMFFAHFCLRPAAASLPPAQRVPLMAGAIGRFLGVVLWIALLAVGSGAALMWRAMQTTHQTGAPFNAPADWLVMGGLGLLMLAIYGYIRVALYRRLQRAVADQDWPAGGAALNEIRFWVATNLTLGTLIVVVVALGQAS